MCVPVRAPYRHDSFCQVLEERGTNFRGAALDVRDRDGWERIREASESEFGPVDVLVNNAGIAPDGKMLADMHFELYDWIIGINLVGVMNGISAFAAAMRERAFGHIVNTTSLAGVFCTGGGAVLIPCRSSASLRSAKQHDWSWPRTAWAYLCYVRVSSGQV